MADVKISALPPAPGLTSTSIFAAVQGGVTYKATVTQVAAAFPTATALVTGLLSSADWTTFNNKLSAAIISINGDTTAAQTLATGTAGTDFVITTLAGTTTFNLPVASALNTGKLSSADWSTFNSKVGAIGVLDSAAKSANGAVISGSSLVMQTADATNPGLVSTGTQTFAGAKTFSSAPTFTGFTAGSVLFAGASGLLSQDNANLFWDDANNRLGIGTATPAGGLHIVRSAFPNARFDRTVSDPVGTVAYAVNSLNTINSMNMNDGFGGLMVFGIQDDLSALIEIADIGAVRSGADNSGSLIFRTSLTGTRAEKMRVWPSGNVLIQNSGTFTDAGFRLDINGTERVQGRLTVNQDTTVATQTVAVIQSGTTNASLVLNPNGTGAIIADIPDGTAAGGNARGNNAVDLQTVRTAANQVASGTSSFLGGGENNRVTNSYSVICGGQDQLSTGLSSIVAGGYGGQATANNASILGGSFNIASNSAATVVGGQSNTASGAYSFVGGGQSNTASGAHSFVGGGQSNTASGQHSAIIGGQNNTAAQLYSISGGLNCQVTGQYATSFGRNNTVNNSHSFAIGSGNTVSGNSAAAIGYTNEATTDYSFATGFNARAYLLAQFARSSGNFSATENTEASAQNSTISFYRSITGQTIQELYLDGASLQAILALPTGATNARMWTVQVQLSAIVTTVGAGTVLLNDCFSGTYTCAIKRVLNTVAMIGNVTPQGEVSDTNMTSSIVTIDADTATYALRIRYTPPSPQAAVDTVIRVVATAYLTEVGR